MRNNHGREAEWRCLTRHRDGLELVMGVTPESPLLLRCQFLGATVEVVKRSELHTRYAEVWVVERSFAGCRRLWKNCERKLNTSLQMVALAFTALILKRL